MSKGIIIGGAIIVAAGLAAPYFVGSAIESKFNSEVSELQVTLKQTDPSLTLKTENYSKGWFSSTAKTVLTIDHVSIPFEHKITHGPWSYFGLAKIETTVAFNGEKKKLVDTLFDGKQPLLITTNIGFSGFKSAELHSAEINNKPIPSNPSTTITWGGMSGNLSLNGDSGIINIKAPKLLVTGTNNKVVEIQNLTLTGDTPYTGGDWNKAATISWAGEYNLTIDKLAAISSSENFSSTIALKTVSTDDQQNVGYNTTIKFTNLVLPEHLGFTPGDNNAIEFGVGAYGIPKKPFLDFIKQIDDMQKQGKTPSESEIMMLGKDFAISFLQGTPSIKAHALLTSTKGDANITAEAKLATPDTQTDLMSLVMGGMGRLEITVEPNFSESLIDEAITQGQLPVTKEEFVNGITMQNRFILDNGKFSGKFEFKNGKFFSNGQHDPELQDNLRNLTNGAF